MKRSLRDKKIKRIVIRVICILLILAIPIVFGSNLKPVIITICSSQAKILCTKHMNKSVVDELENLNVEYSELVNVVTDKDGNITAIETNAVEVNKIKARLTDAVNDSIAAIPTQDVGIPLGTLTGTELLSGRGPKIKLRMIPASYVESTLTHVFDTAGINQTRHQITIEFEVTMTAILAPYSTTAVVKTNVCIAETVIIGHVPEMFADVG